MKDVIVPMDAEEIYLRKLFLELTPRDEEIIKKMSGNLAKYADQIIDSLDEHILSFDEMKKFFKDEAVHRRVKEALKKYFLRLLEGDYTDSYFRDRLRIGYVHSNVGVLPKWYLGAYCKLLCLIYSTLDKELEGKGTPQIFEAVLKVLFLDIELAMDAYIISREIKIRGKIRELERLEKIYRELKTVAEMKDEFISNVSHELKTPLISIKGYSELLRDEKAGPLTASQKKTLDIIVRNTDRLTRFIGSLLFLSLAQAGWTEFEFEPIRIEEVIEASILTMQSIADKKDLTIIKDVPTLPPIPGDRERLTEVFSNLIDNAIKFTPPRGKITITAREEEKHVHINVRDTGIGIPADEIPKLFQRFYQVEKGKARRYGGVGLGLYISKNIINAHRGEIWVESEIGRGTNVHIMLPLKRAA